MTKTLFKIAMVRDMIRAHLIRKFSSLPGIQYQLDKDDTDKFLWTSNNFWVAYNSNIYPYTCNLIIIIFYLTMHPMQFNMPNKASFTSFILNPNIHSNHVWAVCPRITSNAYFLEPQHFSPFRCLWDLNHSSQNPHFSRFILDIVPLTPFSSFITVDPMILLRGRGSHQRRRSPTLGPNCNGEIKLFKLMSDTRL